MRKPVGGVSSSEIVEGEEEGTLLGQAAEWGRGSSSSSCDSIGDDAPLLKAETSEDTPSDESYSSLGERPLPLGAEDT